MIMTGWYHFGYGDYPPWNTVIEIMVKNEPNSIQKVFYGSEEDKNLDKSIPNIAKSGKVGFKLLWREIK